MRKYPPIPHFAKVTQQTNVAHHAINKLISTPDTRKAMYDAGVEVSTSTPEAMTDYMALEMIRWGKIVKEIGIKLD